jgi:hypothetical protein
LNNSKRFALSLGEGIGTKVTKIFQKYPNIYNRIKDAQKNMKKMEELKNVQWWVKFSKNAKGTVKIASASTSIVGGVLCFTFMAPVGVVLGLGSAVVGISTEIASHYTKKHLINEINNIDQIMKEAKELSEIMQDFYDQKVIEFNGLEGEVNSEKNIILDADIGKVGTATGQIICKEVLKSKSSELLRLGEELTKLSVSKAQNLEKFTLLTSEIAAKQQDLAKAVKIIKDQKEILKNYEGFLPDSRKYHLCLQRDCQKSIC